MTYSKLLELIEAMSDEQKAMEVIVNTSDSYIPISMVTLVAYADDVEDDVESFAISQPILS